MTNLTNKIWKSAVLIAVVAVGLFSATSLAINYPTPELNAYGLDTIASSPTILSTSKIAPNSQVLFEVKKPDGSTYQVAALTDAMGIAKAALAGTETKKVGTYYVSAKLADNVSNVKFSTFNVSAGPISVTNSKVEPTDQIVNITDKAYVTVTLTDDFGNPVAGHSVHLISSSATDTNQSASILSDANGQVVFPVLSQQVGAFTYTPYDATANVILNGKARVAYFDTADYVLSNNIPSNYSYGSSGNASGLVDHLSFENVLPLINPGENISGFKITAYDAANQIVVGYNGTIRFSVENGDVNNVILPADYTFIPQDLGSHTFSLALGFKQAGSYQLRVQDINTQAVFGQFIFVVGAAGQTAGTVEIKSPISGTYSNGTQVVMGTAKAGTKIKIFDNDLELTSTTADLTGSFNYTTGLLADGLHKFVAAEVNDIGTIVTASTPVEINIDTTGAKISAVTVEPGNSVDASSAITVKLYSTVKLSKASLVLANNIYDMTADPAGFYSVQVAAPSEFGDYALGFKLTDDFGNQTTVDNQAKLTVKGQLTIAEVVGDVTGLTAVPDDTRVILNWTTPIESTNEIQRYRVYVGNSPTDLSTAIDTFTSATTWYVPSLVNGTEYNFAVVAIDAKGNVSEHLSNIVTATPNPIVINVDPGIDLGLDGEKDIDHMTEDSSKTGPEVVWLILISAIGGIFYCEVAKRRKNKDF
jgi:hypothetical protein